MEFKFIRKALLQKGPYPWNYRSNKYPDRMSSLRKITPIKSRETERALLKYDTEFDLCSLRISTWTLFILSYYHFIKTVITCRRANWKRKKFTKPDHAFPLSAFDKAMELSDKIRAKDLHQAPDIVVKRYCLLPGVYEIH